MCHFPTLGLSNEGQTPTSQGHRELPPDETPHLAHRWRPVPDPSLLFGSRFLRPRVPVQGRPLPAPRCLPQSSIKGVVSLFEGQLSRLCLKEGLLGREVTGKNSNPSRAASCFETQGLARHEGRVGEGWADSSLRPPCPGCQTPEASVTASVLWSLLRASWYTLLLCGVHFLRNLRCQEGQDLVA